MRSPERSTPMRPTTLADAPDVRAADAAFTADPPARTDDIRVDACAGRRRLGAHNVQHHVADGDEAVRESATGLRPASERISSTAVPRARRAARSGASVSANDSISAPPRRTPPRRCRRRRPLSPPDRARPGRASGPAARRGRRRSPPPSAAPRKPPRDGRAARAPGRARVSERASYFRRLVRRATSIARSAHSAADSGLSAWSAISARAYASRPAISQVVQPVACSAFSHRAGQAVCAPPTSPASSCVKSRSEPAN